MNLFKKTTASVALVALVSGVFSAGVAANDLAEINAATSLASKGFINEVETVADFRLGATITRAEMAKVTAMIADVEPKTSCDNTFADITATTPNNWVCGYVEALLEEGLISGNENYNPNSNVSKAEAVKFALSAAGEEVSFSNDTWQADFVAHAVSKGYVANFTDYNTAATRGFVFVAADSSHEANNEDDILTDIIDQINGEDDNTDDNTDTDTETPVMTGDEELVVTLSPETPDVNFVAADRSRTELLAFEVTAGSTDVTLKEVTVEYTGLSDEDDFDVIAVYMGSQKATKGTSKSFSEGEVDLTFENDTVIKAGETKTLVVNAKVANATGNVSHKITVSNLEATVDVTMDGSISSNSFGVVAADNVATLEVDVDTLSDDVTVGEVEKLAEFTVEEQDNEDVLVKSITIEFDNFDAEDDLRDLVLYVDGDEVAADLYVNSDDEVIADIEVVIPQDESVDFVLEGVVVGSIGDTVEGELTDVYAVGVDSQLVSAITYKSSEQTVSDSSRDIEGSEINVSFDKSDIDEAKPSAEDVLVGTLNLESVSDYTIESLTVSVESTGSGVDKIIKKLELDGSSSDSESFGTNTGTYTFEDISLKAGEEKNLDLTFEVEEATSLNGADVKFTVAIVKVVDEENNEDYEGNTLSTVLSTNSLDAKTIDIESASLTLNQTKVTGKEVVLGNGVEVVLYKGKLSVGDSDEVTINDMEFAATLSSTGYNLEDIVDSAELNVGGKTFDADVKTNSLDFTSMNAVIAAGSDNVEVTLSATLKDTDDVEASDTFYVTLSSSNVDAEDSENEDLENLTVNAATSNTVVTLNEAGTLEMAIVTDGENEDEINEVVLAGTSNVTLAEVEIEADQEDIKVQELTFTATGVDLSTTLSNVRLMDGSKVLAEGAIVTYVQGDTSYLTGSEAFTGTTIVFENDFIIENTGDQIDAVLVADLEKFTTEGGEVSAVADNISLRLAVVEAKGTNSNDDVYVEGNGKFVTATTESLDVFVAPAIVTVSIVNELGDEDEKAKIRFDIDKGNNDLDNDDITITSIVLENAASGVVVRNDDNDNVTITDNTSATLALTANNEISNGDEFEFVVASDNDELRIEDIKFSVGSETGISITNDKIIDLDKYTTDNN